MQPLTPAERREIERVKSLIQSEQVDTITLNSEPDEVMKFYMSDERELWLKVLTMALETNETLEASWRQRYDAPPERVCVKEFDDAKRRLGR